MQRCTLRFILRSVTSGRPAPVVDISCLPLTRARSQRNQRAPASRCSCEGMNQNFT